MARLLALALDLGVDFFDQPEMLGQPIAILRLLHYEGESLLSFSSRASANAANITSQASLPPR